MHPDRLSRSNTCECPTRSSTWLRINNNKVSRVTTEAGVDKEATMVGEGTEVAEVEGVEGAVVEEEDHDIGRDKRTPSRRWGTFKHVSCSCQGMVSADMRLEVMAGRILQS
jgi:hypothetical protein